MKDETGGLHAEANTTENGDEKEGNNFEEFDFPLIDCDEEEMYPKMSKMLKIYFRRSS